MLGSAPQCLNFDSAIVKEARGIEKKKPLISEKLIPGIIAARGTQQHSKKQIQGNTFLSSWHTPQRLFSNSLGSANKRQLWEPNIAIVGISNLVNDLKLSKHM